MIRKIRYADIDFDKYSQCLDNACQNADFADRRFLDIVSGCKWFLLIYGNYEAVMPVSYVRKYGLIFILMPKLCQQLGVFSEKDNPEINGKFYNFLNRNFLVLEYAFNSDNCFNVPVQKKTSYLLKKNNYEDIRRNYSSHRRRNVRISGDLRTITLKKDWQEIDKQFFLKNIKGTSKQKDNIHYFEIFQQLFKKNIGHLKVLRFKNNIQSFVYLFEGKNRTYLSLFINGYPLDNPNLPSIMIDQCLQDFVSEKDFDFMGSEVENVAKFNERFGAVSYQYSILTNDKIILLKNLQTQYRNITNFAR